MSSRIKVLTFPNNWVASSILNILQLTRDHTIPTLRGGGESSIPTHDTLGFPIIDTNGTKYSPISARLETGNCSRSRGIETPST